jgi:1,4-dihydroxy-2-naphthoyl-CoA synthase
MSEFIDKTQLYEAFGRLAIALQRDGTVGDIYIFGGAAMILAYQAREATRDVDALFEPREKVHQAAIQVAEELGLPRWCQ